MKNAAETRRDRLAALVLKYGRIADLNEALDWPRTDPRLSQIKNAHLRSAQRGPYQMGDAMARQIETKLGLPRGWMDNPENATAEDSLLPTTNDSAAHGLSADALQIAKLFDLIPRKDLIKRAQAQMACAQTIINLLQPMPPEPAHKAQDNKTQSS